MELCKVCQGGKHRIFTNYYGQNLLFYRDTDKYYYDFSLPVKQTPHQVVTLGCQILICSCSCLIVKLKLYHFIALSAKICYLYKHRSNQIRDYMHRKKNKKSLRTISIADSHLGFHLDFSTFILVFKMTTAGFENYGSTQIKIWNCNNGCISYRVYTGF